MNTQTTGKVNFYEAQKDIGVAQPYAVISMDELSSMIKRFVSLATMIATHPDVASSLDDTSTSHIMSATYLRRAVKNSEQGGIFPNVVLPASRFETAMNLIKISQELDPEIMRLMAYESQKWEED
ncbi:MAG: hypothetical protein QM730_13945 [Anaerolineales bacterium]